MPPLAAGGACVCGEVAKEAHAFRGAVVFNELDYYGEAQADCVVISLKTSSELKVEKQHTKQFDL